MDASDRDEFVDEKNENQDAEAGDGSSGGRKSDAVPWKAAEGGGDGTARVLNQDEIDSLLGFDSSSSKDSENSGLQAIINSALVSYERLPMLEVVFDRLVGGVGVAGEEGACARDLVGGDAPPGTRAAHHDGSIDIAAHDGFGGGTRIIRIVDRRRRGVRTQVNQRQIWLGGQSVEQQLFQVEARVVRS